jgi:outer membrane immunogenic protein
MRCRSLLLVSVILSLAGSAAYAADMPVKAYPRYTEPAPVFSWTGFYAGLNAGYGWANVSVAGAGTDSKLNGFIGGGQLGYNWQTGAFVFGVEGDFQYSAQKHSDSATVPLIGTVSVDQKIPWFATARARLGYAPGPWMLYVTGGAAWVNYKLAVSALGVTAEDSTTKMGWTLGGGVEWMFMPAWSVKLEYLYIDTGNRSTTLFGTTFDARAKDNIVRVGLNYHF